jgi:transcriptional regulator with XRE-family HTH domain
VFVKVIERNEARRLRTEDGLSVKAIAAAVCVSPSTVSRWVRDIALTEAQLTVLRDANPILNNQRTGTARSSANARARRRDAQSHGRELAALGSRLHQAGCMLYWAEGHRNRNQVVFTNADADMLVLFRDFLRQCYDVADEQIALTVNVHLGNGLTLSEIESWWLDRLALPRSCLRQAIVNRPSRASQRKRRTLPYGTVGLRVSSTFIVQSIYGAIQAYAGIDRPAWLD